MSHRVKQVESTLRRELAKVLQRGINDPRVRGLISVTEVDVSPDFRHATCSVSVLPEQHQSRVVHGLNDAAVHIQGELRKGVALRRVPHLRFKLDAGIKRQAQVLAAINEGVARTREDDLQPPTPSPDAPGDAPSGPLPEPTHPAPETQTGNEAGR